MPCDSDIDQANPAVYLDVLSKINHVRSDHPDVNPTIIAGELNTEITRRNSLPTVALEDYYNDGLVLCSGCADDEVLLTYVNEFTGTRSKLDHLSHLKAYQVKFVVITPYTKVIIYEITFLL
jgi:hypothetical protein